ncbi:PIR Superfamily Protein [Plasmodium ovale curtisi]|uniref:PIR Superfamily Protein n=1 Tax=Plasmodium ovale curtisi TaxID=864141 RepID=A0A1A8WQQ1_PLAOA|nr:PIR Superfamily Protein [Plasmodium ovale curtisi]
METQEDPDLNELPSNVTYYKFNTVSIDYTKDDNEFWKTFITKHPMNKLSIFPALAKGFYYVSKMKQRDTSYDERWNYLYFWAGLKVLETSESSFEDLMRLLDFVKKMNSDGATYDKDMLKLNVHKFKDLKKIYEYLENYVSINLKIGYPNAPCTKGYRDYVTNTHALYIREKGICQHNYKDEYCRLLNSFIDKHAKTFKAQLTCTGTKPIKPPSEAVGQRHVGDHGSALLQYGAREPGEEASLLLSGRGQDSDDKEIFAGEESSPSGSTSTLSTVFPLLGTSSLLFFFVKFTPLGSRLYNNIFRKQIIENNGEEQEILQNSHEYSHGNIEDNTHHIAYHSM